MCVDSFVYLCVSFLHKDRSRIFARWLYQWEFQDTTDGGTLVPYNAILYFVGIFPYIGLIYGRYLQFGFLLHGHWQIPGCHKHRIHHLMIFCRMGSLLYIYNHRYIYVVSNDFSREGMGLIVSFRNQTFFELGFKPFFLTIPKPWINGVNARSQFPHFAGWYNWIKGTNQPCIKCQQASTPRHKMLQR